MPLKLLLPNKFKKIGWFLFIPAIILCILSMFTNFDLISINTTVFALMNGEFFGKDQSFSFIHTDITNTLLGIIILIGGLLVGFSKEKNEDEFIFNLRQSSLLWAVMVNYVLLIFSLAFVYGAAFLNVMLYNMFTVLLIFIIRFNYVLYRSSKA